jgi:glycosyltransferase involved in cell wall biosynthesis
VTLRILAFPRDPNPYQELLHTELRRRGTVVTYLGSETRSQSVNVALLPLRIAIGRLRGVRLVHVHWLYPFGLTWTGRRSLRALREVLLAGTLWTARLCGVRIVWTLHNVVPHSPIFTDDRRARRRLVDACDLVIAHSAPALDDLERRTGAAPRHARVIPLGPFATRAPRVPRRATRQIAFFGKIELYKGVEELLEAFALLPPSCPLRLTIAGVCTDPSLRERIERAAAPLGVRVSLRLEHLPAADVDQLLADVDALVLPFRAVTTTSTAGQAQANGVPVVIPDLDNLAELRAGTIRYDGTVEDLAATLDALTRLDARQLDELGAAAYHAAHERTWGDVAVETLDAYRAVTKGT